MDFSRLFTEDKNWIIAEKIWELPDDPNVLGIIDRKLKLTVTYDGYLDDRGVKLIRITLVDTYKRNKYTDDSTHLRFTPEMINAFKNIEYIKIKDGFINWKKYDYIELPADCQEEIKQVCKIIIEDMNQVIGNSKKNGKLLDGLKSNLTKWLTKT